MTDHPDHELTTTVEAGAEVSRCKCGQFSYASTVPNSAGLALFFEKHVKEMTDDVGR